MDNVKNDQYYAEKILADIHFIIKHMDGVDKQGLNDSEILLDSMLFRMIQISENAKKLSEEYKNGRIEVPWEAIYGLRNRIVHDYGSVDLNIVYDTLKTDIPELLKYLESKTSHTPNGIRTLKIQYFSY